MLYMYIHNVNPVVQNEIYEKTSKLRYVIVDYVYRFTQIMWDGLKITTYSVDTNVHSTVWSKINYVYYLFNEDLNLWKCYVLYLCVMFGFKKLFSKVSINIYSTMGLCVYISVNILNVLFQSWYFLYIDSLFYIKLQCFV